MLLSYQGNAVSGRFRLMFLERCTLGIDWEASKRSPQLNVADDYRNESGTHVGCIVVVTLENMDEAACLPFQTQYSCESELQPATRRRWRRDRQQRRRGSGGIKRRAFLTTARPCLEEILSMLVRSGKGGNKAWNGKSARAHQSLPRRKRNG